MHLRGAFIRLVLLTTLLGIGHHVDHVIRGNHVGWPLIPEITPFTYSLGFYPVIALGLYLEWRGSASRVFWAMLSGAGFLFVSIVHFGLFAVEPPIDILDPYADAWAGYAALGWLALFLLALAGTSVYAAGLWWRERSRRGPVP
jgi:hypothetical protein